ncbi:MAG: UDP-2,3-diacylglucosamine diphosphatase LpxI domain-containing protein, partial [Planctomycetota bacterium]
FDVPAVGPDTVRAMREAGGKVLALEAGMTLILGVEETLAAAEEAGITLLGVRSPGEGEELDLPTR